MSSFPILDLVIGMIFIFFLLSIICSSAVELWLSIRQTRAKILAEWLRAIFNLQALDAHGVPMVNERGKPVSTGQAIMDHCMITALSSQGKSNSYLSAENFVTGLLDKISVADPATNAEAALQKKQFGFVPPPESLDEYIIRIKQTKTISAELQRTILLFAFEAKKATTAAQASAANLPAGTTTSATPAGELDEFRTRLQNWYDMNASRLTGTMKRKALPATIIVAIALTLSVNADTIAISKYLYDNREVAKTLADNAANSIDRLNDRMKNDQAQASQATGDINKLRADIDTFKAVIPAGLPLGWQQPPKPWRQHLPGWIASIFAIVLGAPFWFDLLNKLVNLRNTRPKPPTALEKGDNA